MNLTHFGDWQVWSRNKKKCKRFLNSALINPSGGGLFGPAVNLLAVKGKNKPQTSILLWITYGHLPRTHKQTNKQSSLSVEEVDYHHEE